MASDELTSDPKAGEAVEGVSEMFRWVPDEDAEYEEVDQHPNDFLRLEIDSEALNVYHPAVKVFRDVERDPGTWMWGLNINFEADSDWDVGDQGFSKKGRRWKTAEGAKKRALAVLREVLTAHLQEVEAEFVAKKLLFDAACYESRKAVETREVKEPCAAPDHFGDDAGWDEPPDDDN